MNRSKIENVLHRIGVPAHLKGFRCIADAMEVFDRIGVDIGMTKELYPAIAEKEQTTPPRVERAIRHAFSKARDYDGDIEAVEKYIGFTNPTNKASLVMLYKKIKAEECESDCDENPYNISYFEEMARRVIKEELPGILSEMFGMMT